MVVRFALPYRDIEELLAERGIKVDHVTVYRWVQRFTPLLAEAARPCRHRPGDRWFLDDLLPEACHVDAARENNRIEADHSRLKARLRPMRGLERLRSVQTISTGNALVQNIRRGHYELAAHTDPQLRLAAAFTELTQAV